MEDVVVNSALGDVTTVSQLFVSIVGWMKDVVIVVDIVMSTCHMNKVPDLDGGCQYIDDLPAQLWYSDQPGQGDLPPTEKTNICLYMYTLKLNRQPMFATNRGTYNGNC